MHAANHGNVAMLHRLVSAGADLNIKNKDGKTACMIAAGSGQVKALQEMKASPPPTRNPKP